MLAQIGYKWRIPWYIKIVFNDSFYDTLNNIN